VYRTAVAGLKVANHLTTADASQSARSGDDQEAQSPHAPHVAVRPAARTAGWAAGEVRLGHQQCVQRKL